MSDPDAPGAGTGAPIFHERVEPPPLPWNVDAWPEESRRSYGAAVRRIGLVAEPRVVAYGATDPTPAGDDVTSLLAQADAVLVALWTAGDAESRVPIAEALAHVDAVRSAAVRDVSPDVAAR
jgi:hypothetical protein